MEVTKMNEYDELMNEENEVVEFEGGKDYSTAIGAGAIAVGGVLVYEGVKHGVKYAKIGVGWLKDKIVKHRGEKDQEAEKAAEETESEEK
jgi:hypothetical protein